MVNSVEYELHCNSFDQDAPPNGTRQTTTPGTSQTHGLRAGIFCSPVRPLNAMRQTTTPGTSQTLGLRATMLCSPEPCFMREIPSDFKLIPGTRVTVFAECICTGSATDTAGKHALLFVGLRSWRVRGIFRTSLGVKLRADPDHPLMTFISVSKRIRALIIYT